MAILCRSLGRVGGVDEEILIRCGADMMGSGRHGDFLCVVCLSGVSCHFCEMKHNPYLNGPSHTPSASQDGETLLQVHGQRCAMH
jgi:hypothetical protein